MKLFFDTETTGFPKKDLPLNHPSQPHIVQLAAILVSEDKKEVCTLNTIIDNGYITIPEEATKVHGITTGFAKKNGVEAYGALSLLNYMMLKADEIIGHNIDFDMLMYNIAINKIGRYEFKEWDLIKYPPLYCTMKSSTNIVGIPHNHAGQNKWPKLTEAYKFAFGEDFDNAHNAMADVRATMRLYYWLKEQGK